MRGRKGGKVGLAKAESALREFALAYPDAYEEFPWGHRAIKVKGKTFTFIALEADRLSLSVKLPTTGLSALMLPFATPTGYGLGKSGWVTAAFSGGDDVPLEILSNWLDESYRAIAPKRLVATMSGAGPAPARRAVKPGSPRTTGKARTAAGTKTNPRR